MCNCLKTPTNTSLNMILISLMLLPNKQKITIKEYGELRTIILKQLKKQQIRHNRLNIKNGKCGHQKLINQNLKTHNNKQNSLTTN